MSKLGDGPCEEADYGYSGETPCISDKQRYSQELISEVPPGYVGGLQWSSATQEGPGAH